MSVKVYGHALVGCRGVRKNGAGLGKVLLGVIVTRRVMAYQQVFCLGHAGYFGGLRGGGVTPLGGLGLVVVGVCGLMVSEQ